MLSSGRNRMLSFILKRSKRCFLQHSRLCSSTIPQTADDLYIPEQQRRKVDLPPGPSLEHFIANSQPQTTTTVSGNSASVPYIREEDIHGNGRKVYFDVHGCQMNTNDTEIAWSILQQKGYLRTLDISEADVVLVMTCAIREGAENKIWKKLRYLGMLKRRKPQRKGGHQMKIGLLGCMAERLKTQIVEKEKAVDVVCGPDAYRDLPRLLATTFSSQQAAVNVLLSLEETYADVMPVRLNGDSVSAYVSIMRGCDNMCSYCIVPFTRGRERSRPIDSIVEEIKQLSDQGIKEVTLLGQNVNSYRDLSESQLYSQPARRQPSVLSDGFKTIYKTKHGGRRFSDLLDKVSQVNPEMRIRFTSPHPKDFPDEVLELIRDRANICHQLHLPAQSGNNSVLSAMRRGYTIEAYLQLVDRVRTVLPGVALTSDFICGFCGETEDAHRDTLELVRQVQYNMVYYYPYSMRQKTHAHRKLVDDVPEEVKNRRSAELGEVFRAEALKLNSRQIGEYQTVLLEKVSRRSDTDVFGRNDAGTGVVLPSVPLSDGGSQRLPQPGDYVLAKITDATSQTLLGEGIKLTKIAGH